MLEGLQFMMQLPGAVLNKTMNWIELINFHCQKHL